HIANGDMVTMTLLQGIINAIVIFAARVIAHIVASAISKDERGPNPFITFGIIIGLEILLSLLGAIVVNYFSRRREFRADKGGARYAGRDKMLRALRKLQGTQMYIEPEQAA